MRIVKFLFVMWMAMGDSSVSIWAQMASWAAVLGVARDPSGAVVAGAQVTLYNSLTNATREQSTNGEGLYAFPDLAPGSYVLTVHFTPGYTGAQPIPL
jgi:hypothetical protein